MKVEEWLAAVNPPDDSDNLPANGATNGETKEQDKRKDVYGKVLELYCLFLLSRNEEWEFAQAFISGNFYLSENKKKAPAPSIIKSIIFVVLICRHTSPSCRI